MKKKVLLLTSVLALGLTLAACGTKKKDSSEGEVPGSDADPATVCVVNFYTSYNAYDEDQALTPYKSIQAFRGKKISKPENPQAEYPEFPVFKGWSTYHILDELEGKLWDFDNDVAPNAPKLELFGIWAAEGE